MLAIACEFLVYYQVFAGRPKFRPTSVQQHQRMPVAAGRGGQVGAIAPGRRRRGGAAAAPGEGAFLGEVDFVAML